MVLSAYSLNLLMQMSMLRALGKRKDVDFLRFMVSKSNFSIRDQNGICFHFLSKLHTTMHVDDSSESHVTCLAARLHGLRLAQPQVNLTWLTRPMYNFMMCSTQPNVLS